MMSPAAKGAGASVVLSAAAGVRVAGVGVWVPSLVAYWVEDVRGSKVTHPKRK